MQYQFIIINAINQVLWQTYSLNEVVNSTRYDIAPVEKEIAGMVSP